MAGRVCMRVCVCMSGRCLRCVCVCVCVRLFVCLVMSSVMRCLFHVIVPLTVFAFCICSCVVYVFVVCYYPYECLLVWLVGDSYLSQMCISSNAFKVPSHVPKTVLPRFGCYNFLAPISDISPPVPQIVHDENHTNLTNERRH